jgi:hypothetical protein
MPESQHAVLDLRPLGLGELLDRTFTLYRNNFFLFCGIMAIPETVIAFAGAVFTMMVRHTIFPLMAAPQNPLPDPRQVLANFTSTFGTALIFDVVYALIYIAAVSATTFAVASVYLGNTSTIREAYRKIRGRIGALLGFFALIIVIGFAIAVVFAIVMAITVAIAGAALSGISPILSAFVAIIAVFGTFALAIWLLMRFSLSLPVLLLENRGPVESMARSGTLTQGHRGRVFLGIIVIFLIALAITTAITAPSAVGVLLITVKGSFLPTWLVIAQALSSGIAGTLTGPLLSIALALVYYDVRIRKEAFDLELMLAPATAVTATTPAPGPVPLAP